MTSRKARPSSSKTPTNGGSDEKRTTPKPDGAVFVKWDPKKTDAATFTKALNELRIAERKKRGLPV